MTLDEAIIHEEKVVSDYERLKKVRAIDNYEVYCLEYHRQLAEWLKELKVKEEINQSLLYENERLLKSVQEIKAEIKHHRKKCASIDKYDLLGDALDIIDKHMSWEGEK